MASKILQANGDDHPEAAGKNLTDAQTLQSQGRHDGAGYLAGYVIECCLKTAALIESGPLLRHHGLAGLSTEALHLAGLPSAKTAKYAPFGNSGHPIYDLKTGWRQTLRYKEQGAVSAAKARDWIGEADFVYQKTVVCMRLDGVI